MDVCIRAGMSQRKERKKRVSVTVVRDDDVVQHILHVEDKKSGIRQREAAKRALSYSTGVGGKKKKAWRSGGDDFDVEDSSDGDDNPPHLSAQGAEDDDIAGNEVFSFRTPKRSGQMAARVSEIRENRTPSLPASGKGTKRTSQTGRDQTATPGRKRQPTTSKEGRVPQTTTPYRLRKRNVVDDSSDEDSVGEESNDEESEEEEEDAKTDCCKPGTQRKAAVELTTNAEEYFDLHASAVVTSDRTLSRLELPQMDVEELRSTLDKVGATHTKQRTALCHEHQELFRRWMFTMCNGFNVLLYGVGSKRHLMEQFRSQYLAKFSHLVVNGYFPSLNIKQILTSITEDILGHEGSFRSPLDHVQFIGQRLESQDNEDVYLVVHNLDGATLRGETTQNVLSLLAQVRGVHLLASVDHINAPLIWDQTRLSRFRWAWQDVTTYTRYLSETSYEHSLLLQQSGGLALRSLAHVMRSLTPNARRIFELLAQHQVDNADHSTFIGLSFQDLYVRCRECFLVNSDQTLRAQLVEFTDHKLIRARKNYDGVEHLLIPIETPALKEFLEQGDK